MAAIRRIHLELRAICKGNWNEKLVAVRVPDPTNLLCLQGIIISPENSPTGMYIFFFDIYFPAVYPFQHPIIKAVNKMWHPKIDPRWGGICLAELSPENWEPSLKLDVILPSIQILLADPGEIGKSVVNKDATEQYIKDKEKYNAQALEWARKHNKGYGLVQFEDYRLSAIQSVLTVPDIIPYECHLFCQRENTQSFKITAAIIPSLIIYRESIKKYLSIMKRLTFYTFKFSDNAAIDLYTSKRSRDNCWEFSQSEVTFTKVEIDKFDPRKSSPPHCNLTLTWLRPERNPIKFIEKFQVKGKNGENIGEFDMCVDPESFPTSSEEENPTLPQLLSLTVSPERSINVAESVGNSFFEFGVLLLNDATGQKIRSIEVAKNGKPKDINMEILTEWVLGKGQPVTWEVLVSMFEKVGLSQIANDIKKIKKV